MMHVLVILLAVIGLVLLVLLTIGALSDTAAPAPPTDDPATPYREGLHAAVRMQRVAQDLEQQIYAEAAQHMDGEAERSGTQGGGQA
jgi:hypothetical protein